MIVFSSNILPGERVLDTNINQIFTVYYLICGNFVDFVDKTENM